MSERDHPTYDIYDGGDAELRDRLTAILALVEEAFPPDENGEPALFMYPDMQREEFVAMTAREAMFACGPAMARSSDEGILASFTEMRRTALDQQADDLEEFEDAKMTGRVALARIFDQRLDGRAAQ